MIDRADPSEPRVAEINPRNFDQQVQGAVAQGIGHALSEELEQGRILDPDLARYLLPTSLDVPEIESIAVATVEAEVTAHGGLGQATVQGHDDGIHLFPGDHLGGDPGVATEKGPS